MKKNIKLFCVFLMAIMLWTPFQASKFALANENTDQEIRAPGMSISLTPVSKFLQISPNASYDDSFIVNNGGTETIRIETYAAPYSYTYSTDNDSYQLGFNNDNNYTQIARWITFKDDDGSYAERAYYTIEPNNSLEIHYRIATPSSIPAGGQYAVIFAHTLSNSTSEGGIKTEASPGMIIYGRSNEGETSISAEISNMEIGQFADDASKEEAKLIGGVAKVKNNGNVDFNASGTLKIEDIFGNIKYETPAERRRISLIPESGQELKDVWKETPGFGLFKVTWTIEAGDSIETIEKTIFINPMLLVILTIILLTIIIMWAIIFVKRRKTRRSRFSA